jgi:hypothetical protein
VKGDDTVVPLEVDNLDISADLGEGCGYCPQPPGHDGVDSVDLLGG